MRFYRKLIPIEAEQWNGEINGIVLKSPTYPYQHYINTISGIAWIEPGDYIVKEARGNNYYPVKREIFESTYQEVFT